MIKQAVDFLFANNCSRFAPFHIQSRRLYFSRKSQEEPLPPSVASARLPFQLVCLVFTLSVLIVVWQCQKKLLRKRHWIDALPGPRTYPIVGGLLYFSADLTQTFKILLDWSKKYGPIFRSEGLFNDPYIIISNPDHFQAILSSNNIGVVSKPRIPYDSIFGQFLKNGLLVSEGEYWKSHRRIVSRAFTYKSFSDYTKIFNRYSKRLILDLEKLFPEDSNDVSEPKQISELIHCCSLQIVCASVMGLDLCDSEEGALFNEKFQRYKIISSQRAIHFWFLLDIVWKLHPISREYNRIIDTLNDVTRKIIKAHSNNNSNTSKEPSGPRKDRSDSCQSEKDDLGSGVRPRKSMIDEMLASDMTPEEVLSEANTVIAAGFESTSLTIHYLLLLLALNPEHQRSCQQEIDEIFSDPVKCQDGDLTLDSLSELKYLERCCYETLRLFPVIFMIQRKSKVPVKLDDKLELPAGVNVILPIYTMHRNPEYFPEPEKFDPDRFLPENSQKRHPYAYLPFSSGIRICIGYKFAIMEIKAVAARILRHFSVSTVDKIDDVPILPSIVMTPVRDYKFRLARRSV